ncbi:MAG: protease modulator HflK [Sphingobium sp.]|nr:protease modulator HflK [Sphingobium sp.]
MDRMDQTTTPPRIAANEGGPWGGQDEDAPPRGKGGPRNPWTPPSPGDGGHGPGRGPDRGPDRGPSAFDELFRRARDNFGNGLGGQPGGGRIWILLIGLIVLGWIVFTSSHSIGQRQRGVVSLLGSYSRTLGPGFNLTLPAPFETVRVIEADEIRTINLGTASEGSEKLVLTGDQNLLNLSYSVRWNVSNPRQFAFQFENPEATIGEVADSAMRGVIANVHLIDAMGGSRAAIEQQVQQRMQEILDSYGAGVRIQGVAINKADPPDDVVAAFKEVTAAQQAANTDVNNATGYARRLSAQSQGEAAAFDKVYEQYKLSPEVTRRRMYYETMEAVLGNMNKTVLETNGVMPYMQLPPVAGARPLPEPARQGGGQ